MTGNSKAWLGQFGELGHPYTHPSTKQCNYSYSHPSTKQCDAAAGNHTHSGYALSNHTHSNYLSSDNASDAFACPTEWISGIFEKCDSASGPLSLNSTNHGLSLSQYGTWSAISKNGWTKLTITTTKKYTDSDTWTYHFGCLSNTSAVYGLMTGSSGFRLSGSFPDEATAAFWCYQNTSAGLAAIRITFPGVDDQVYAIGTGTYLFHGQLYKRL